MFDNVLVGVDRRTGGRDAIELARRLAAPGAEVTFGHVYGSPTAAGRAGALALSLELEAAELLLGREAQQAPLLVKTATVYESSVGRGLHRMAQERGAELLVVGSCHRGRIGRVLLGDDAASALRGAPCAVAVAPRRYASARPPLRLGRIGVGSDDSPESARAIDVARALAARHHSGVEALAVVSLHGDSRGHRGPGPWPPVAGQLVVDALHRLDALEGVEVDATYGDPPAELAALSDRVDLLIVGSRGHGPVGRILEGSTSEYLARRAQCPLLVLPRSAPRPGLSRSPRRVADRAG